MILCDGNYGLGAYGMDSCIIWNPGEAGTIIINEKPNISSALDSVLPSSDRYAAW